MSRLSATQQKKYLGKLRGAERAAREAEILYRREHRSDDPFVTDEGQPTKRSKHAAAFERKYGRAPKDTADAARLSGVPKKTLDEVYARGMAAWQTGHRPGASQHAWAMARVESFLTGGPTSKTADADLAREVMVRNPTSYPVKRLAEGKYTLQVNGLTFVVRQSWADRRWHIDVFSPRMVEEFGLEYGTPFAQLDPQPTKRAAVDAATDAGLHREQYPDLNLRKERANDHMMFETEMGLDALNRAREYARRNPAVLPQNLPESYFVKLRKRRFRIVVQLLRQGSDEPRGLLVAESLSSNEPFIVTETFAPHGYGPLLYDVAMEVSSSQGLMSDRESVSDDARAIWDFYLRSRSDVSSELREDIEHKSGLDTKLSEWEFSESPLARVYYANGTPTIDALRRAGKLVVEGEGEAVPMARNPASQTHVPPAPVAAAARRGLELRASQPASNRCCTSVGLRRASQLANRQPVSEDTMRRMLSYFQRHEVDKQGKDWSKGTSKGLQAWLCWGGDEGYAWVRRVLGV